MATDISYDEQRAQHIQNFNRIFDEARRLAQQQEDDNSNELAERMDALIEEFEEHEMTVLMWCDIDENFPWAVLDAMRDDVWPELADMWEYSPSSPPGFVTGE